MKQASAHERQKTIRRQIVELLEEGPTSARQISPAVGIMEKEVYDHLEHIARSLKSQGAALTITPAVCLGCGYVFEKRQKLTPPGRCPKCRSTHIEDLLFEITAGPKTR